MDRFNLTHTYDALNRLTSTNGDQGYKAHTYTYDSLGNLIKEKIHNKSNEYWYNELNQQVQSKIEEKTTYNYTFDNRGNLISGKTGNKVVEAYTYDATNRMVKGVNESGEESHYVYNGLGYLVGNEWIIAKNAYGYNGVSTDPSKQVDGVVRVCTAHKNTSGQGHQNPTGAGHFKDKGETNDGGSTTGGTTGGTTPTISSKHAVVHKDYVIDYTSALGNVIMETESGNGGLTYRYVYGLDKVSTAISGNLSGAGNLVQNGQVKLWYHHDRLGTTEYLTDNVSGKVTSYVTYDSWGAIEKKPNLKMGVRELDLVTEYTGYMYDQVLGVYYAKARMYDAADRRFMAVDPVKGSTMQPATMVGYTYCLDNPIRYIDPSGKAPKPNQAIFTQTYYGARAQISEAQKALNWLGYTDPYGRPLTVDGIAGGNTQFAIRWFQMDYLTRHGSITIDGILGPRTWAALSYALYKNEFALPCRITAPKPPNPPPSNTNSKPTQNVDDYMDKNECGDKKPNLSDPVIAAIVNSGLASFIRWDEEYTYNTSSPYQGITEHRVAWKYGTIFMPMSTSIFVYSGTKESMKAWADYHSKIAGYLNFIGWIEGSLGLFAGAGEIIGGAAASVGSAVSAALSSVWVVAGFIAIQGVSDSIDKFADYIVDQTYFLSGYSYFAHSADKIIGTKGYHYNFEGILKFAA